MKWYLHLAYVFGGAFLVNAIPHFVSGVTGHPFPSPFASPPGQGMSSATVNVLWGTFNFLVAYLLIGRVGEFKWRQTQHVLHFAVGGLLMALMSARVFGRVFGGL